jgi:rod shape determining protein RodA
MAAFIAALRNVDWLIIGAAAVLIGFGVLFIYGAGEQVGTELSQTFWKKQLVWIAAGAVMWAAAGFTDYRKLGKWSPVLYAASIILLLLVWLIGTRVYGARRWISLGGIKLQPTEFAKISFILLVSWLMSLRFFNINKLWCMAAVFLLAGVPAALVLKQPDLGSAIVFAPLAAVIMFIGKLKFRYILAGVAVVMIAIPLTYPHLSQYQKERILVFVDPARDPQNRGWNQLQSELAVGSGGLTGKGFLQGTQNAMGFLPQTVSHTDFIFSVIAEETGFAGVAVIMLMYALILAAALRTAVFAPDIFGRCLACAIAVIFFTHSVINIGMCVRLMPVTGLPLPLISYGGSFMVSAMLCLGFLQSIYARRNSSPSVL